MKTPHLIAASLALIFILAFLSDNPPVNPETPEKVTITYWEKWTGFEGEAMKSTIDAFNRKKIKNKKGQVIFCNCLSVTQVDRKSSLAIAGGQPPDICGFWGFNTHLFAEMGALRPLDDLIARDKIDSSKYIPVFWEMCQHRGKTWCLPTTPATVALHWNRDMFQEAGLDPDKPPRTTEELEQFADKLTKRDSNGRITQMGFLPPEPGWWNWCWGYFFGGKLEDGLDKLTANDPKNVEAFTWIAKFAEKYGREDMLAFQQGFGSFDSPQNAFLSGRVAMVLQGVWMANFIRFHRPHMKWACGPFPSSASFDTKGEPVTIADMDVVTIPRGAKYVDEAWEVIKYINSPEGMELLCGNAIDPTTGKSNSGGQGKLTVFREDRPGFIERHPHPYLKVFIELAKSKNAITPRKVAVWDEYHKEMNNVFELVWLNKKTPKEALDAAQRRLQPKLDSILAIQKLREDEWK